MVRILSRYLAREVLTPAVIGLAVFTFLLEVGPVLEVAEKLIAKGVPWSTVGHIVITLLPQALAITIPMALLVGVLIGFGRLSGDREAVALQACGVSIFQMLKPVALLTVSAWAAASYMIMIGMPWGNQTFREITYNIVAARAEGEVKPRVFFEYFPNLVLYVRDIPSGSRRWTGVFLADTSQPDQPLVYLARYGRILIDRSRRSVEMVLEDGTRYERTTPQPGDLRSVRFDRQVFTIDPETVFPRTGPEKGDREKSIAELRQQVDELRRTGQSPHRPIMEIHKKFSIPIASFVFGVIGLALGVTSRKDGRLAGFVLAIGVIFVYYVCLYLGEAMAKGKLVPAELAMWIPNILLGPAGLFLLVWRARSVERRLTLPSWFHGLKQRVRESTPRRQPATADKRVKVVIRVPRFWLPRPNILDWYVARLYYRVFILAFVGMLTIFYISTFIDLSDKLFKGTASGSMLVEYFWYQTPQFVYWVIPIAVLIATLASIGSMTKNSELVVMRACGISLYRTAVPLFFFGALWSGVLFMLQERVLAQTNRQAEETRHRIRGGSPRTFNVLNRRWLIGREGDIYHYVYFDPRRGELNGLSIFRVDYGSMRLATRVFAARAVHTSRGVWELRQGWEERIGTDRAHAVSFTSRTMPSLEPPEYFGTEQPDAELMSSGQLARYIKELRSSGFDVIPLSVDLYRKVSFPFVTLVMTLIAVPFAVTTGRRGALYGIGIGIVLAFTYWGAMSVFAAIGKGAVIAPLLAAWAPNLLFAAGAGYLLLTVRT